MTLSKGMVEAFTSLCLVAGLLACTTLANPAVAQTPEGADEAPAAAEGVATGPETEAAEAAPDAPPALVIPEYVARTADGEIVLTPESAARWAAERNTRVRIQQQAIPQAEGQLQEARAGDALRVNVSASAIRMGPVTTVTLPGPEDEEPMSFDVTPDQMWQATVSANKPLYTGGRVGLSEQMARAGIDAAEHGTDVARLSISQGARGAVYGVLRSVQLSGVAAARVTAVAEHVRNAELMEEAGIVPQFDVVQARTELSQAQEQLIMTQTAIEQARAQLRRILALPQETPVNITEAPPAEMPEGLLPELIDVARANRPEVTTAESALRIAELNRRLAGRHLAPTVALTGQYTRQTEAGLGGDSYSWQVGVVAEKPIFDGGVKRARITSAEARVEEAELEVQQAQEQVALEVVQAWLSVQEARERIGTAQQGLVEARERRRMAQLRYREGLAPGIEVIDADTALAAAEASLVNAEYDRQLAVTQLRTAMGIMEAPRQEGETE